MQIRASTRRDSLVLVSQREKANRLLRRISPLAQEYGRADIRDAVIQFCTDNTYVDCMFWLLITSSFSPIHWWLSLPLLAPSNGPPWAIKMMKERFEVLLFRL